jgi:hypothetical protein
VFSLLNRDAGGGNFPARMCTILNPLPQFLCSRWPLFAGTLYLFDGKRLNRKDLGAVGHRIAFLDRRLSSVDIRGGKD